MIIQYKSTIWNQINVNPSDQKLVLKLLKESNNINDLFSKINNINNSEILYATKKFMDKDNVTIEVYHDDNLIWSNEKN